LGGVCLCLPSHLQLFVDLLGQTEVESTGLRLLTSTSPENDAKEHYIPSLEGGGRFCLWRPFGSRSSVSPGLNPPFDSPGINLGGLLNGRLGSRGNQSGNLPSSLEADLIVGVSVGHSDTSSSTDGLVDIAITLVDEILYLDPDVDGGDNCGLWRATTKN
jgi:hypothetical protein